MRKQVGRWLACIVVLTTGFASVVPGALAASFQDATPAAASSGFQFGIGAVGDFPNGYFEITLEPGKSESLTARVINTGDPADLRAFAANVTSPPNGGFGAGTEEDPPTGPTTWLDYAATSLNLATDGSQEIPFTVTVPEGTAPGQYVAALVVRTADAVAISGTTAFDQIIRSAVAVMITVPGPTTAAFELGTPVFDNESGGNKLDLPVVNTGNILVKPAGTITVTTADGTPVVTAPISMGSVYGGLTSKILLPLPDQLQPGDYLISATLTDEASGVTVTLNNQPATLADRAAAPPQFAVAPVTVRANGIPIQYVDVSATINNTGITIPTATVTLNVQRDGQDVEAYVLAQNQALATGDTVISQRYIPAGGWSAGTYTFQLVVASVEGGAETILLSVEIPDTIVVSP